MVKEVKDFSDIPQTGVVVLDFYADWCQPCKMVAKEVDLLDFNYENMVEFYKVNVDNAKEIAKKFNVMSLPTLCILKEGVLVDQIVGITSVVNVSNKLDVHLQ